jgi:NADPH:quinone reductase-like Zn-dependent oxidoreductase
MKAAVYYENGPPSVLKYEDVEDPHCYAPGVVIKAEAVSIEGGDTALSTLTCKRRSFLRVRPSEALSACLSRPGRSA